MPEHEITSEHSTVSLTRGQWSRVLSWAGSGEALAGEIVSQLKDEEREPIAKGREHLTAAGLFRSDKYPWSKDGFVPLKVTDEMAWPMLRAYAAARQEKDLEFTRDLDEALDNAGAPSMNDFDGARQLLDAYLAQEVGIVGSPTAIADMMTALAGTIEQMEDGRGLPQAHEAHNRRREFEDELLRLSRKVE